MANGRIDQLDQELDARCEHMARLFHEAYERLAPDYGYRTRDESAVPWDVVPEANKALMCATVREMVATLLIEDGVMRAAMHRPYDEPWPAVEKPPLGLPNDAGTVPD